MPYLNHFHIFLILTCGYALWMGRSDERLVASTALLASFGTRLLISPVETRYSSVELGVLLVDLATLAAFTFVALRSDRFWPLWISGLQLTTSVAHLLKALEADLFPLAYAAAGRLWAYPVLAILAIGTWRGHRRRTAARQTTAA